MKKITKLLVLIMIIPLLFSCGKKDANYGLIEITGPELSNALENNDRIIYATINFETKQGENFKRDIERAAKELHLDIYYVDSIRLDFWVDEGLYVKTNIDTRKNYYYYNDNGDLQIYEYTDYKNTYDSLKDIKSDHISKTVSDKEKEEYLEKAKKAYKEGKITDSYYNLTSCWTLPEAKEFYNNSKYFKLMNE